MHTPSPTASRNLYTAAQVRALERRAIERHGIPGIDLMERAGHAAYTALRRRWPRARRICVLCGIGNNGGDGFIFARLAHAAGLTVTVWQVGDAARIHGDAHTARQRMEAAGLTAPPYQGETVSGQEVLVDALFGTGLNADLTGAWRAAIDAINAAHASGARVLALDIPSGLHADSGAVLGGAVAADMTVTFIGLKLGLFTGRGPALCGEIVPDALGVPQAVYQETVPAATRIDYADISAALPPRARDAHKGQFGHVLVVGGEQGMSGAARMAAEAAARVGAGLVSVATRTQHAALISAQRPELMSHGVETAAELAALLARAGVVAAGPGLGQGDWGNTMLGRVLGSALPLVVDADALNLLAANPARRDNWILTPHPGEAARLLGIGVSAIQADRVAAAGAIQQRYGGVAVLKGAGTVVADMTGEIAICSEGNPGMASGGMGDVLTGVIAGLVAQGLPLAQAARLGVCLHARAADVAARDGLRGLLATDLLPVLRRLVG